MTSGSRNENALKWVIENVSKLCDEFARIPDDDNGKEAMHLELSMVNILDELEMPMIDHAKHEAQLLTRLHNGLSRLIEQCDKALPSSNVAERLKAIREELEKLFSLSPMCALPPRKKVQLSRSPKTLLRKAVIVPPSSKDRTSFAERTATPTSEVMKAGHEQERSDRVVELDDSALKMVRDNISNGHPHQSNDGAEVMVTSSDESRATRTPDPANVDDDERSQQIWVEPVLQQIVPVPTTNDAVPSTGVQTIPIGDRPTLAYRVALRLGIGILAICLFVIALEWKHEHMGGSSLYLLLCQAVCSVANFLCENYGVTCGDYCASGLQRDKWRLSSSD